MRNIKEIASEDWFKKKEWLILGTGPTLDQFKPEYLERFNIWALYCAIDVPGYADVFHYQDIYVKLYEDFPTNYRYCAVRPGFQIYPERTVCIEYAEDVQAFKKSYTTGQLYPKSNSTSFAFLFLCSSGIKKIHTLGIDFSNGISDKINPFYKKYTEEYNRDVNGGREMWDVENATNNHWCKTYGTEWIKLDKR